MTSSKKEIANYAMGLLARREYTRHSLAVKMKRRFLEADQALFKEILDFLESKKYLSDQRFAEMYAREKILSGWGENKIRHNLRLKNIDNALLNQIFTKHSIDREHIKNIVQRKYRRELLQLDENFKLEDEAIVSGNDSANKYNFKMELNAKINRFLLGRGFSYQDFKDIDFFVIKD